MKKKIIWLSGVLVVVIALVGLLTYQKKEPILFDGQGDNWRAEVITKPQSFNKEEVTTTLQYVGKDKKSIGDFNYNITSKKWSWGMGAFDLNAQKSFTNKEIIHTFKKMNADDSFEVKVDWEGHTESFVLSHK